MNELKEQLEKIAFSDINYRKIARIGDRYNLMLDSQDELAAEIIDVIRGLKPAKNLTRNIVKRLEIDSATANKITNDVNLEIFTPIREQLQQIQAEAEQSERQREMQNQKPPVQQSSSYQPPRSAPTMYRAPVQNTYQPQRPQPPVQRPQPPVQPRPQAPLRPNPFSIPTPLAPTPNYAPPAPQVIKPTLEQAGRFTVDKPPVGIPQYKETNINKDTVLKGIEDKPIAEMVDHLLTAPVNNVEVVEIKKPIEKKVVENIPYSSDPYREEI